MTDDKKELEDDIPETAEGQLPPDIITAVMNTEREIFVEQLGDDKLDALTSREWAGFASLYLVEATDVAKSIGMDGYTKELMIKERQMLLKALAITNEAIRRHMSNSGFPIFASADFKTDKPEDKQGELKLIT